MIRILGGLAVLATGVCLGHMAAARLEERQRRLFGVMQGIILLAQEIGSLHTPLPEALNHAADGSGHAALLFRQAAILLMEDSCCSGEEALCAALAATAGWWQREEYAVLQTVAAGLGLQDAETQVHRLELAAERLSACEKEAALSAMRFGRLCRSMGWVGGAAVVLLLL